MPTANKIIRIQEYTRPSLQITATLDANSYFPGQTVSGTLRASTLDGSPFSDPPTFDFSVFFEDELITVYGKEMSKQGVGKFIFDIPSTTQQSLATVSFTVVTSSVVEYYAKPVPIAHPDQVVVDFFPETGFFVPDVTNKVYFAAYVNEERYDSVEFEGGVVVSFKEGKEDRDRKEEKKVETKHRGKGVFEVVPEVGRKYELEV